MRFSSASSCVEEVEALSCCQLGLFESLRQIDKFNIIFLVKECSIEFKKPAFFEDTIKVVSKIDQLSRVKIKFFQKIFRGSSLLAQAKILVIPVNRSGKISKLPDELYLFLEAL